MAIVDRRGTTLVSVPPTLNINTTAPLTGGGNLSADRTLGIALNGSLQVVGGLLAVAQSNALSHQWVTGFDTNGLPLRSQPGVADIANGQGLTGVNDTNVTIGISVGGVAALLSATQITIGWNGTLAAARLNSNVVQGVTNDTNITGSIAGQVLTLGWTGTLAAGRLNSNVVQGVTNDANVTGSIAGQNLTLGWTGQLSPARGGTGVNNGTSTITIGGNVTFSGAFTTTFTVGAATNATLPSGTHTLAGLDVAQTWSAVQQFADGDFQLKGATSGTLTVKAAAVAGSNTITFPAGTTDFSSTGGASQFVKQNSTGGPLTVAQPAHADLSDYATGTWTPVLQGATTPGTFTYAVQVGSYERIGRLVVARFNISISATSVSPVGALSITGLPLTSANVANDDGAGSIIIMKGINLDANYSWLAPVIAPNSAAILLFENSSSSNTNSPIQIVGGNVAGATPQLAGVVMYHL
ncbi:hypothetical protein ACVWW6_006018 [Bradyrhizobium sp. USDA 3311]